MSTAGWSRRGAGAVRLLALLAVVLGLLAMHGLAGTHHAAAAGSVHLPAAADVAPQSQHVAGQHLAGDQQHGAVPGARVAASTGDAQVPLVPACGDDCPSDLAVLCVAVLAAVAGTAWLVAAAARRRVPAACTPGASQPRAPVAARRLVTGPDLVRELCVSRT